MSTEQQTPLTITPGKFYRTRDGQKARIYAMDAGGPYPVHGAISTPKGWTPSTWTNRGDFNTAYGSHDRDIISEWIDLPEVPWHLLPKDAQWVTMGGDSEWQAHEMEPRHQKHVDRWISNGNRWRIYPEHCPTWTGDWRNSLVQRPKEEGK